ncbi:DUF6801 domain-containing protein [Spirillospora sp. NPDC048911]|uniref:DUF6801 domain-containing protein n=1 Tax=Spirillospora sp. NPDC048911 TaxID=3364527 RepID=UPI003722AC97
MKKKSARLRTGIALGTATGVAVGLAGALGAGTAAAAPAAAAAPSAAAGSSAAAAAKSLTYTCNYPLIGKRQVKVDIETNVPAKLGVGQSSGKIQVTFTATLGADTTSGLGAVDGATIEGAADAKAAITGPGFPNGLNVNIKNAIQPASIPASGSFQLKGYGEAPALTFDEAGPVVAKLGAMDFTILLKKKDGSPAALGTFKAACTQDAGQDPTVVQAEIVEGDQTLPPPLTPPSYFPYTAAPVAPGVLKYGFTLGGKSLIKNANGTVPLKGTIGVDVDGATGAINGDLFLGKTSGQMNILGFLPVTAEVDFEQIGKTVGTYAGGEIATTSTMNIKMPNFLVFGAIPIGGGANCKTSEPSVIKLTSPAGQFFNPKAGGKLGTADYKIAPIKDCGALEGILSLFAAGTGNTIDLDLTPKA